MLCDICNKKKATVHLTEIIDGEMSEMHLCEDCAREKSVQMEQQFGLADLLAGLSGFGQQVKESGAPQLQCSNCGTSYDDFRKFGRLGCSECYNTFGDQLGTLLRKIHGSSQHLGKTPPTAAEPIKNKIDMLQELRRQLQQAVEVENFEKAAKLRDQVREMERKKENQEQKSKKNKQDKKNRDDKGSKDK